MSPGATSAARRTRSAVGWTQELRLPTGYFFDVGGRVESQERATRALVLAVGIARPGGVRPAVSGARLELAEALVILATLPDAFVGGILALWIAGETWNVSSLVGLIGLFGIAVQNGLVLVTQTHVAAGRGHAVRRGACARPASAACGRS